MLSTLEIESLNKNAVIFVQHSCKTGCYHHLKIEKTLKHQKKSREDIYMNKEYIYCLFKPYAFIFVAGLLLHVLISLFEDPGLQSSGAPCWVYSQSSERCHLNSPE